MRQLMTISVNSCVIYWRIARSCFHTCLSGVSVCVLHKLNNDVFGWLDWLNDPKTGGHNNAPWTTAELRPMMSDTLANVCIQRKSSCSTIDHCLNGWYVYMYVCLSVVITHRPMINYSNQTVTYSQMTDTYLRGELCSLEDDRSYDKWRLQCKTWSETLLDVRHF